MSDKFHEYGWMFVARDDKMEGDEHFDCGKWFDCPIAGHCDIPRRRRITAPEGWRVMGIEERILGEIQSTLDGINWKTYTGEFVDVPFSTKKITVGDWPGILAIATPIKCEAVPVNNPVAEPGYEAVTDLEAFIGQDWRIHRIFGDGERWTFPTGIWGGKVKSHRSDYFFARPITGSETASKFKFHWGDKVHKVGGDYTFEGAVVSVFAKLSGRVRYVVEDDRGCLHIYSEKNLEAHGK